MHTRTHSPLPPLLLIFLLLFLIPPDLVFPAPSPSAALVPSPARAPAPAPVPLAASQPKNVASNRGGLQLPPPPPPRRPPDPLSCYANCPHGALPRPHSIDLAPTPGKKDLNFGEKLGLAFAGIAIALQVVLGSFLVFKRMQLKKLEDGRCLGRTQALPS